MAKTFRRSENKDLYRKILKEEALKFAPSNAEICAKNSEEEIMANYAELYGARYAELLTGGTSAGIIAAIMATVPRGGKLILARNSFSAAFDALRLENIEPVYLSPEYYDDYRMLAGILADDVRLACDDNPDATAILITSPDVYGVMSDISEIAEIADEYDMTLIVDQTYGAHLKFFDDATGAFFAAENCGADIVVNGTGETLFSLQGTGVLNICTDRVKISEIEDCLRIVQSEPSLLSLGSLDINEQLLEKYGPEKIAEWVGNLQNTYDRIRAVKGVTLIESDAFDVAKITFGMQELGVSGKQLAKDLNSFDIAPSLVNGNYVTIMTGISNTRADYLKLVDAIHDISGNYAIGRYENKEVALNPDLALGVSEVPARGEWVALYKAEGRVLYDPIVAYPPGGPIACPGEVIDISMISFISEVLEIGGNVSGIDEDGRVYVGVE